MGVATLGSSARSSDEFGTEVATNVRSRRPTRLAAKSWGHPESRSRGQTVPTYFLFLVTSHLDLSIVLGSEGSQQGRHKQRC